MKQLLHTPDGVRDIYNFECEQRVTLEDVIRETMNKAGFRDIKTPTFEYFDVFSAERGTVPSRDMYKFFDRDGNTLVLRPDMTPAIARCVAKYFKEEDKPIRLCYCGSTFINGTEYQGKLKEITQIGAELINEPSVDADAEMIALTIHCLKAAGLSKFQVEIGQADFFRALVEEAGLDAEEVDQLRYSVIDKNTFGMEGILADKNIREVTKQALLQLPELFGAIQTLSHVKEITDNQRALQTIERLETLYLRLKDYGLEQYITFDLGALSKYNYYTGITFQAFTYGTGNPVVTGGRYDSLVGQFGKEAAAIGFALSLEELMTAMTRQQLTVKTGRCQVDSIWKDVRKPSVPEDRKDGMDQDSPVKGNHNVELLKQETGNTNSSLYAAEGRKEDGYITLALAKGRLAKQTMQLLEQMGILCEEMKDPNSRKLVFCNEEWKLKFFLAKASDVPTFVEYGAADIGVVGKDTIDEEGRKLYEVLDLKLGRCRMCVAGPKSAEELLKHGERIRVATKYPGIAKDYFYNKKHQTVEIIKLNGSVELAPIVGLSEVIVDIVETGSTLRENGLDVLEEICPLSARVVVNQVSMKMEQERITKLINGLREVMKTNKNQ